MCESEKLSELPVRIYNHYTLNKGVVSGKYANGVISCIIASTEKAKCLILTDETHVMYITM